MARSLPALTSSPYVASVSSCGVSLSSWCDWKRSMRSVLSRFSEASTDFTMWARDRPLPSGMSMPHLVAINTLSRLAGSILSQLPMTVSDSPPL